MSCTSGDARLADEATASRSNFNSPVLIHRLILTAAALRLPPLVSKSRHGFPVIANSAAHTKTTYEVIDEVGPRDPLLLRAPLISAFEVSDNSRIIAEVNHDSAIQ